MYFNLLKGKEHPNLFNRALQGGERISGMACGIPDASGLTDEERRKAQNRKVAIVNNEAKSPLSLKQIEWISAFTGLLAVNGLRLMKEQNPKSINILNSVLDNLSDEEVPDQYKSAARQMLGEMKDNDTTFVDAGINRAKRIFGRFYPVANIITGFMAGVMVRDIKMDYLGNEI